MNKKKSKPRFYTNIDKNQREQMYENIGNIEKTIGMNIYSEIATLNKVKLLNGDKLVIEFDSDDFESHFDLEKEVQKNIIKNNLFLVEFTAEDDYLVIHTTDDLQSMLYSSDLEQLEEIREELNKEKEEQIQNTPFVNSKTKTEIFSEIITSKYSYNVEQPELSELELITNEILQLKRNMAENIILIGSKLKQVKDSLKHGEFGEYLETQVDFTRQTANKFMKIADEFTNSKSPLHLGSEKLYILTTIPKEEREEFITTNNIEEMSTRELTKAIKEMKVIKKTEKEAIEIESDILEDANVIDIEPIEVSQSPSMENRIIIYDTIETIANKDINDTIIITKSQLNSIKFDVSCKVAEKLHGEDKITVDTLKVLKKVDNLIKEIKIRTGRFYNERYSNDDIKCDDRGGIIAQLFAIGEITEPELIETVKEYNIDLEINFKELLNGKAKENYLNDICNSYHQYDISTSESYIGVLNKEMCYENVVEFRWEKNEKERLNYIEEAQEDLFTRDNITITRGYDETTAMVCVYRGRETLGYYKVNIDTNLKDITKLFKFYKIDNSYLDLVERFIEMIKVEELAAKNKNYESIKKDCKFINCQTHSNTKYTFILKDKPYEGMGDKLYIFKDIDLLGEVTLEDVLGGDNFDIELDHNKTLLKILKQVTTKCWDNFKKAICVENTRLFKARKAKEESDREWQKKFNEDYSKNYSSGSYDFGGMLGKATIKEEEKPLYKKFYKTLAINYHPDKIGGTGEEMKVINQLKTTWGI